MGGDEEWSPSPTAARLGFGRRHRFSLEELFGLDDD
jgi:hypothetical protein